MGLGGLEPPTSRLSGVRSNQLSYRPTPSAMSRRRSSPRGRRAPPPPSLAPGLKRNPGPGLAVVGRIEPGRRADQARSQSQAPERERIAHGPENPRRLDRKSVPRSSSYNESRVTSLPRKEVIQPHLPVRLPCYDLAPITGLTLGACLLTVGTATSGPTDFRGLTGGVYKARERIHRCLLISDY